MGQPLHVPIDLVVAGTLYAQNMVIPAASVGDSQIPANAGIEASKLMHQHRAVYAQGSSSTTAAADTKVLFTVYGTSGTIIAFRAGAVVPNVGAATCTVDLRKNGTTVLSAVITLNSSQTARQLVSGAVTTTAVASGDVLEVVVTATAGGGTLAQGLFASLTVNELPQ